MTTEMSGPQSEPNDQWDGTDIEPVFSTRYHDSGYSAFIQNLDTEDDDEYIADYFEGDRFS